MKRRGCQYRQLFVAGNFEFETEKDSNQEMGNQLIGKNSAAHRVLNRTPDLLPDKSIGLDMN